MGSAYNLSSDDIKRIKDTVWGEAAGGSPEEIHAVTSTILNRFNSNNDIDKTLNGYNAYRKRSKQYQKARLQALTPYEKKVYDSNATLIDAMTGGKVAPIADIVNFENVRAFGNPPWKNNFIDIGEIGRQHFYKPKKK